MCGRYTLTDPGDLLSDLGVETREKITPRYNVAPTQQAPVVRATEGGRELASLRWGLVPFWSKDLAIGNRMINARSETAHQKPAFRQAFAKRRCLILTDGFYEWAREGGAKQPYHIHFDDRRAFTFAGLWERWSRGEDGPVDSFTILTTSVAERIRHLHDRMPVILTGEARDRWLDPELSDADRLRPLLAPYESEDLVFDRVSRVVNNPRNDVPECIKPWS